MKINPGDTIVGASGAKLIVDRIEGDTIYSGTRKINKSAVVEVIPAIAPVEVIPPKRNIKEFLKAGDRVYIPACDKYGRIELIFYIEGKEGLFGRVRREDGEVRDTRLECLELAK